MENTRNAIIIFCELNILVNITDKKFVVITHIEINFHHGLTSFQEPLKNTNYRGDFSMVV